VHQFVAVEVDVELFPALGILGTRELIGQRPLGHQMIVAVDHKHRVNSGGEQHEYALLIHSNASSAVSNVDRNRSRKDSSGSGAHSSSMNMIFAPLGVTAQKQAPDAPERKYALGMVRQRLHQATFRCIHSATISAFAEDYAKITDAAYCVGVLARNIDLMKKECGHGFGGTDS